MNSSYNQPMSFDSEEEYEEYLLNRPLAARFDPDTIEQLVVEGFEKHEAYGMMFSEYQVQRARFLKHDDAKKKQMGFFLPSFFSRIFVDLSISNKTSHYRFIMLLLELGLITFQHDYAGQYRDIREYRNNSLKFLTNDRACSVYSKVEQLSIALNSGSGFKAGKAKHFVPSVPDWLYGAISDTSATLGMSISDICFLCLCIAVQSGFPEDEIPSSINRETYAIVRNFETELENASCDYRHALERLKECQ